MKKRDEIVAALRYELHTPRHPDLRDDPEFLKDMRHKLGALLCQAEECGKQDYEYIVKQSGINKEHARSIIKGKRTHDFLQKNVVPLMNKWDAVYQDLVVESRRLDGIGHDYTPSEKWEDLADEWLSLAREIDRKTTALRMSNEFPSYIEKSRNLIHGSMKLANPEMPDEYIKSLIRLRV